MADPQVNFRISVAGAQESAAEVQRVRNALEGVQGNLDAHAAANSKAAATSTEMSAAEKQAAVTFGAVGAEAAGGARGVLAQTQEVRSLANALLADLIPGLRIGGREVSMIGREFSGSTESSAALALGFGALAVGVGIFLSQMKEANREVQAARFAALTEDLGAAESSIKKADQAISDYNTNVDLMGHKVEGQNAVQGVLAAVMVATDTVMQQTNAKVREAIDLNTGYMGGLAQRLGHLTAEKTALEAQKAALEIDRTRAQSVGQLTDVYAKEAEIITRTAAIDAEAATRKGRLEADAIRRLMERATTEDEVAQLSARAKGVEADAATKAAAIKQKAVADVARLEMDAAKAAAESWTQYYEQSGTMADLRGKAALDAAKTGEAFVEAAHRAEMADAQFFGTSLADLEGYQAKRRASIETEAAIETQRINQVYEAERQAQLAKLNDPTLGPAGRQAVLNKLEVMEQQHTDAVIALDNKRAVALRENDNKVTEERRANYKRDADLAEQAYQQLAAMGQEDVAAHIRWAQQRASDENLGKTDQMKYEKEAFDERRKLEQDSFALSKALGLTNEVDELNRLARLTSEYGLSATLRIKAETDWATEAKRLRNEVADIGKSAIEKVIGELEAEGNEQISLGMIQQRAAQDASEAFGAIQMGAAGGVVDIAQLKAAFEWGPIMGAATQSGVGLFQAMGAQMLRTQEQFMGIRDTAVGATRDLGALGVPVVQIATGAQVATEGMRAFGTAGAAAGAAVQSSFAGAAAGAGQLSAQIGDMAGAARHAAIQTANGPRVYSVADTQAINKADAAVLAATENLAMAHIALGAKAEEAWRIASQGSERYIAVLHGGAVSAAEFGTATTESLREGTQAGQELELTWFGTTKAMAEASSSSDQIRDGLANLGDVGSVKVGQVGDAFRLIDPAVLELGSAVSDATAQMAGFGQVGPLEDISHAVDDVLAQFSALGSAGAGAADTLETSLDQLGGSLGGGLKSTLDATISYVDDYWTTLNDKIKAGASETADNIFGTLNDRIKDELDAEARAS